ncbi:outer membrane protein assembly factor BamB family protein [Natronorubrum sp. FCH18a]|uniref:outer membrane protein assembly factor BamB family protein n=1 Tax=Natronorubrum sp. FCH18a TaxID=3447018 RepID=UPI003F50F44F
MPSRRRLLASVGLAAAGSLGAHAAIAAQSDSTTIDWPMDRYDAAGTGYNPDASGPKDDVEISWAASLERTGGFAIDQPVVVDGTVYAGTDELVAFDAETGDVRFSYGKAYGSSPAHASASVYRTDTLAVATPDGIVGLNAGGGIGLFGHRFGAERWQGPGRTSASFFGSPETPAPVAVGETVYAAVPDTSDVVALEAGSGRERWRRRIEYDGGYGATPHRPAVRDGTVFVTAQSALIRAFDVETGDEEWRGELEDPTILAPTATEDGVVVPTRNGAAVFEADGSGIRWVRDLTGNATDGAAAVADGTVFVTDDGTDGSLHALDLETGDEEWSVPFGPGVFPVVADGVVYATDGYELAAFDAETGEERFTYEPEWYLSPPAVGDGVLYVVDGDRVLAMEDA